MTAPLPAALRDRLHTILRNHFILHARAPLAPSTPFMAPVAAGGLGADHLDRIEITVLLEGEFAIAIDDDTAADARTVGELEDWLADNLRHCRTCGCTENRACTAEGHPCGWSAADQCTACTDYPRGEAT